MLDFPRLTATYHIPTRQTREGWTSLQCPRCGASGSHGGWYLAYGQRGFHCWRCGKMSVWEVLSAILPSLTKKQLWDAIQAHQIGVVCPPRPVGRTLPRLRRREGLRPPPDTQALGIAHIRYLRDRGFDPDILAEEWGVRGVGRLGGIWAWRVVYPIRDGNGRIVAWQGRHIGPVQPKYRLTPDAECLADPHTLLYGLDRVTNDAVIVVEGVTGVWRLGIGAVATLGIGWRQEQLALLRQFKRRYICFDSGEAAAQARAVKLAQSLSLFPGVTEVINGFDSDPGDFSLSTVKDLRKSLGLE
jgi:DNA primase catalytic core, N-terminal domain